jgi:hypothetical protein
MTAAAISLRSRRATTRRIACLAAVGRLLRLELRHNLLPWLLPLLAVLFWFDTYRTGAGLPALWGLRTQELLLNHVPSGSPPGRSSRAGSPRR